MFTDSAYPVAFGQTHIPPWYNENVAMRVIPGIYRHSLFTLPPATPGGLTISYDGMLTPHCIALIMSTTENLQVKVSPKSWNTSRTFIQRESRQFYLGRHWFLDGTVERFRSLLI